MRRSSPPASAPVSRLALRRAIARRRRGRSRLFRGRSTGRVFTLLAVTIAPVPVFAVLLIAAAGTAPDVPTWVDSVSRVGVVGLLAFALIGLHRKWWVPGWIYTDLQARHGDLRSRYDSAIQVALQSSHGVERAAAATEQTTSLLEQAIANAAAKGAR